MKKTKRLLAMLLVVALTMSNLAIGVSAAEPEPEASEPAVSETQAEILAEEPTGEPTEELTEELTEEPTETLTEETPVLALSEEPAAQSDEAIASGTCGENLTWTLVDGVLTISGTGAMHNYEKYEAPWNGIKDSINSIEIMDGVTEIGSCAFYETFTLRSVTIPPSLKRVGYGGFYNCNDAGLTDIYISDFAAWLNIEFGNFSASPFNYHGGNLYLNGTLIEGNVTIPENVSQIGTAIYNWNALRRIIIPASVSFISGYAFDSCGNLKEIIFQGDAPELSKGIFQQVTATAYYPNNNSTWNSENMLNYSGDITWVPYTPVGDYGIIVQPLDQTMYEGEYANFSIVAIGNDLTYQWQYCEEVGNEWIDLEINDANTSRISIEVTNEVNGNQYRCIIKNGNGEIITSNAARLNINTTTCYHYTHQRVSDTMRYLDEVYIEKYPELGLHFLYGDSNDRANLQDLVDVITEGCTTDREKADAIHAWIRRNIEYSDENAFPTNTFYTRKGVCIGQVVLMQSLLRLAGIPAVWGDGWRGDMELITPATMFNMVGHAWCWAYVDGEWVLYDPLWLEEGTTDREYMAKWLYLNTVETIVPAYDQTAFPPTDRYFPLRICYTDGKFMVYNGDSVEETNNAPVTVLNTSLWFFVERRYSAVGGSSDGIQYLDSDRNKNDLINGELYCDGWLYGGGMRYAYENGILASGTILERNNKLYYADLQSTSMFEILADPKEYSLYCGYFSLPIGYHGKPLETTIDSYGEEYTITWESDNPALVSVDETGKLTVLKEGMVGITAKIYRNSDNTYMGGDHYMLWNVSEKPKADYSDEYTTAHEHRYTSIIRSPTCTRDGYTIHTCTFETCAHSHIDSYISATGHTEETIPGEGATCTETGLTDGVKCSACGTVITSQTTVPAKGHSYGDWVQVAAPTIEDKGSEQRTCSNCGGKESRDVAKLENVFGDVSDNDYYATPVAWAASKGITTGKTATTFAPKDDCTRAEIVTFLWRSQGKPEPKTTVNPFSDVKESNYYYKAVLWAVENGITTGTGATTFSPNANCTRAQAVTFLWRGAGKPTPSNKASQFTDLKADAYYVDAVAWAVENGITTGTSTTAFSPEDTCIRGQIVTFLWRYMN